MFHCFQYMQVLQIRSLIDRILQANVKILQSNDKILQGNNLAAEKLGKVQTSPILYLIFLPMRSWILVCLLQLEQSQNQINGHINEIKTETNQIVGKLKKVERKIMFLFYFFNQSQ